MHFVGNEKEVWVKFAKATPDGEQNEADYLKTYYFVEETKIQERTLFDERIDGRWVMPNLRRYRTWSFDLL